VGAAASVGGLVAAFAAGASPSLAVLVSWDAGATVFLLWVWTTIAGMDATATAGKASGEDDSYDDEVVLVSASVASLVAVAFTLIEAGHAHDQRRAVLTALAGSRDRGEADRARAILLTLSGWTSPRIAEAFSVREDTVRLWRSDFSRGGTDALKASVAPGPSPVKSETALRVVAPLLEEPVANRPNWTIARMRAEIELREGVRISRSQLSKALRKKSSVTGGRGTP